jgi:hypothetical protein
MGRRIGPTLGAIVLCLPTTLLIWAVVTFLIAVIAYSFQNTGGMTNLALRATEGVVVAVTGAMLFSGVVCLWVLWTMWRHPDARQILDVVANKIQRQSGITRARTFTFNSQFDEDAEAGKRSAGVHP